MIRPFIRVAMTIFVVVLVLQVLSVVGAVLGAGLAFGAGALLLVMKVALLMLVVSVVRRHLFSGRQWGSAAPHGWCGADPKGHGTSAGTQRNRGRDLSPEEAEWEGFLAEARHEVDDVDTTT